MLKHLFILFLNLWSINTRKNYETIKAAELQSYLRNDELDLTSFQHSAQWKTLKLNGYNQFNTVAKLILPRVFQDFDISTFVDHFRKITYLEIKADHPQRVYVFKFRNVTRKDLKMIYPGDTKVSLHVYQSYLSNELSIRDYQCPLRTCEVTINFKQAFKAVDDSKRIHFDQNLRHTNEIVTTIKQVAEIVEESDENGSGLLQSWFGVSADNNTESATTASTTNKIANGPEQDNTNKSLKQVSKVVTTSTIKHDEAITYGASLMNGLFRSIRGFLPFGGGESQSEDSKLTITTSESKLTSSTVKSETGDQLFSFNSWLSTYRLQVSIVLIIIVCVVICYFRYTRSSARNVKR